LVFSVHTISAKRFLASCPFNKKCLCRQLIWPNFCIPLTLKIFLPYGYFLFKSSQHSIIWRWAVLCQKQDGGWIKICEIFCGNSLKEDLSIDTTFDPCYFSWDSPFKCFLFWILVNCQVFLPWCLQLPGYNTQKLYHFQVLLLGSFATSRLPFPEIIQLPGMLTWRLNFAKKEKRKIHF